MLSTVIKNSNLSTTSKLSCKMSACSSPTSSNLVFNSAGSFSAFSLFETAPKLAIAAAMNFFFKLDLSVNIKRNLIVSFLDFHDVFYHMVVN